MWGTLNISIYVVKKNGAIAKMVERATHDRYSAIAMAGLLEAIAFCIESFGRLDPTALFLLRDTYHYLPKDSRGFRGWGLF